MPLCQPIHSYTPKRFCNFNFYAEGDINLQASSETFLGGANERLLFEKRFKETKSYLFFTYVNTPPTKKSLSTNGIFSSMLKIDKKNFQKDAIEKFQNGVSVFLRSLTQEIGRAHVLTPVT